MSTAEGDVSTSRAKHFLALGVVVAVAISLVVGSTALAASGPPFEPDPASLGGLRFFNAAGIEITSGNIADAPFAAYVQTSGAGRDGDTKATLFGYLPRNGVPIAAWTGEVLTLSTNYPNAAAPGPLNASPLPLVGISSADETLGLLQANFPNTAPVGDPYEGLYQLRVKTSGPGQSAGGTYYSADIKVVGTTWSVVYSNLPTTTTTTTSTAPTTTSTTTTAPPTTSSTTTTTTTTTTVPSTTSTTTSSTSTTTSTTAPPTTSTTTAPPTTTSTTSTTTSTTAPPTTSTTSPPTTTSTTTSTTAPPTTSTTTEPPTTTSTTTSTTEPPTTTSTTTSTTEPPTTSTTAPPTSTTSTTAPPTTPSVTVTQTSAPVGGSFALSSKGWAPGEKIDVAIHSTPVALGQLTVDETGSIAGSFVVPEGLDPGAHTISLSGKAASGEVVTVSASLEVTGVSAQADSDGSATVVSTGSGTGSGDSDVQAADPTATGGSLAYTGTSVRPLLVLAIACAAAGSALVLISRRRRTHR